MGLRPGVERRREAFASGLEALGFTVELGLTQSPGKGDVLVIWNRYGQSDSIAQAFERAGRPVLVAENATWGNRFSGDDWYSLWIGYHNRADRIRVGADDRWDALGVRLDPFRADGGEVVGLPQRGIGPGGVAMPRSWTPKGCDRIRPHPGIRPCMPLHEDLANASNVVTWGSGAAVKALMWGVKVESHMPLWCGEQDNTHRGRLDMFRRLAWAQWRVSEIANGDAFRWMLRCES